MLYKYCCRNLLNFGLKTPGDVVVVVVGGLLVVIEQPQADTAVPIFQGTLCLHQFFNNLPGIGPIGKHNDVYSLRNRPGADNNALLCTPSHSPDL